MQPQIRFRHEIEHRLTQIWRGVLRSEAIGRADDFFVVGGDSVAAVEMIAAVKDAFGVTLPLRSLLRNPTIQLLAGYILNLGRSGSGKEEQEGSLVAIRAEGARPPLFVVHGFLGHILFAHFLAEGVGEDQPAYAFRARGLDGQAPPHTEVEQMAADYVEQMRAVQPVGPYHLAAHCSGSFVMVEMGRQLQDAGEKVGAMIGIDPPVQPGAFIREELGLAIADGASTRHLRDKVSEQLEIQVYGRGSKLLHSQRDNAVAVGVALDAAFGRYEPKHYPGLVTIIASAQRAGGIADENRVWRRIAGNLQLCILPGGHENIFLGYAELVAALVRRCLDGEELGDAIPAGGRMQRFKSVPAESNLTSVSATA